MTGKWLSPRRLREYYIDHVVPDCQEGYRQLFLAVSSGEVRARWQDNILDPRWFKQFDANDSDPFALPPDVELSVEDAGGGKRSLWQLNAPAGR
jgi:hypothetical protein